MLCTSLICCFGLTLNSASQNQTYNFDICDTGNLVNAYVPSRMVIDSLGAKNEKKRKSGGGGRREISWLPAEKLREGVGGAQHEHLLSKAVVKHE